MIRVTENLALIRKSLAESAIASGREPNAIKLLAVSKKQPVDKIHAAAAAGHRDFGENFVQEALTKIVETRGMELIWHFIGHLQNNKTRDVAAHFHWVHTIDTLKTARRLSQQRPGSMPALNICLQVNIDHEPGKSGVHVDALPDLAAACVEFPNLKLRGLMCVPRNRAGFDAQRAPFAKLRQAADALRADSIATDSLSMGMSNDYAAAIREGATIVRIGTAIFGERK